MHHRLPAAAALTTSYYAAPQQPDDARRLFDAATASAGFGARIRVPLRPGRGAGSALILAREWGLVDLDDRLSSAIELSYEPTWDADSGEFTWRMGLDEPHPRGQFNAFLAAAEAAGPGRWTALSQAPLSTCPQVVDVDVPDIVLSRAEWVDGSLHLTVAPVRDEPRRQTEFRIVGARGPGWTLAGPDGATIDGRTADIVVRVPLVGCDLVVMPGDG